MIIAAHQTMLAPQGAPLPYDAEVEYLESTGTQYVDTGITPDNTTSFSAYGYFPCDIAGATRMGSRVANHDRQFVIGVVSTGQGLSFRIDYGNAGGSEQYYPDPKGTSATYLLFDGPNQQVQIEIAGDIKTRTFSSYSFSCPYNIFLFAGNYGGTVVCSQGNVKISSCIIYKSGVLVRKFRPVRKAGVGYLFDSVSGTLFGNAGTGAFVVGPDK